MQKMQLIQPEIKKLQAQYKDDRQKLNEEIMKFYKENKINPMAGLPAPCAPDADLLRPVPRCCASPHKHLPDGLEALPGVLRRLPSRARLQDPRGCGSSGWTSSQGGRDAHGGFTDALPYFLLIALVVVTGYLQFKQTQSRQTTQANPQMAMMGKIFPVMFAFISYSAARPASCCTSWSATPGRSASRPSSSGRCLPRRQPARRVELRPGGRRRSREAEARNPSHRKAGSRRRAKPGGRQAGAAAGTGRPAHRAKRPAGGGRPGSDEASAGPNRQVRDPARRSDGARTEATRPWNGSSVTGRTVAEAVEAALDELGVDEADIEYEVLEEPKRGLF